MHIAMGRPVCVAVVMFAIGSLASSPSAHADEFAYLVNVTMRPGYNFANAEAALAYGREICDRVAGGPSYVDSINAVKTDLATDDDYQAAYLINQAVNELCPALIWQLRQSAAHYTPNASPGG
jgi:hypothetical protein